LHRGALVAAQVEGQAYATQSGRLARPHEILPLAPAPAVHEQDAGQRRGRREHGPQMQSCSTFSSSDSSLTSISIVHAVFDQ
jgi:hypothetical protein